MTQAITQPTPPQDGNGHPQADGQEQRISTEAPAPAERPLGLSHRDAQRLALRDLMILATECATTEAQIEAEYKSTIAAANEELEKALWAIEQRFNSATGNVRHKYAERLAAVNARYATDSEGMRKADKVARRRIQANSEPQERDVRAKYEDAIWIADSALEASQARAAAEAAQVRDACQQQIDQVSAMEQESLRLLQVYGQPAPAAAEAATGPLPAADQLDPALHEARNNAENALHFIQTLRSPQWIIGSKPVMVCILFCVLCAAGAVLAGQKGNPLPPKPLFIGIGAGVGLGLGLGLIFWLRSIARKALQQGIGQLQAAAAQTRQLGKALLEIAEKQKETRIAEVKEQRVKEAQAAKDKFTPILAKVKQARDAAVAAAQKDFSEKSAQIEARRKKDRGEADDWNKRYNEEVSQVRQRDTAATRERHQRTLDANQKKYDQAWGALKQRLADGLGQINAPANKDAQSPSPVDWNDPAWRTWVPPKKFLSEMRFGELLVDLPAIASAVPKSSGQGELKLVLPPPFTMTTTLVLPRQASLFIQTDRTMRDKAIQTLQMTMLRLLTGLPPGRVRFTLIDPVALGQNFAGFMHLADHDDALVGGGRIWTEREQIDQRLIDMTEHMETVIQKYLRNEYDNIDAYNAQAGELSEPYRFIVIADFPAGFEAEALRRLDSIVNTGSRCGVYTLVARDTRQNVSGSSVIEDLENHSVNLVQEGEKLVWKDEVFQQFPLVIDPPAEEDVATKILDVVGRFAKEAKRVELPFEAIAPSKAQIWTGDCAEELVVPIGRMGATRQQTFRLGKGVAQHSIVAGKTGSGKSTLLHVLITNLSLWFSPDQLELYLIDFKKGVEFKTYASHELPHAKAIAVESDREFGLSVLQRLDAELSRRGELYRKAGVQDLKAYRKSPGAKIMPRILLIIDEFQEFFTEDDKLAAEAALLIDRLCRQGRAFGTHVLLGSQTIGGAVGLSRGTLTQMAVRIALMTSDADSQIILGDGNSAARLLSRPGEAIYNDVNGSVEANSPFQISWLDDDKRDVYLRDIQERAKRLFASRHEIHEEAIVFEGNVLADAAKNKTLNKAINGIRPDTQGGVFFWLGDPVAIKDSTYFNLRKQSGGNLILIGQNEEAALSIMIVGAISAAAQQNKDAAIFYILDGTPPETTLFGQLEQIKTTIPHEVKNVEYRNVEVTIQEIANEVERRRSTGTMGPSIYVLVYGLQRYRMLRKADEDFSFSSSAGDEGAEKKIPAGKLFVDLLREGPPVDVHIIAWCDTPASVERTFDRNTLREFDGRILFQMSANDSSNLIDSPVANKLGFFRGLIYSEEQGALEKFRPYALPSKEWLDKVKELLAARAKAGG